MTKQAGNSPIKLIIVDFYGVISAGSYKNTCEWISEKYGISYKRCYDVAYHKYFSSAALGKITEAQSFELTAKELGLKEDGKQLRKKHLSFQKLNKRALNYFVKLQNQGFTILLLSKNTPGQFAHAMKEMKIRKYLKNVINTYDLRLPKASPKTLRYVLSKFKVKPDQALMIDDQDFNLVPAKKMGIKTILYKSYSDVKNRVEKVT